MSCCTQNDDITATIPTICTQWTKYSIINDNSTMCFIFCAKIYLNVVAVKNRIIAMNILYLLYSNKDILKKEVTKGRLYILDCRRINGINYVDLPEEIRRIEPT